MGMEKIRAPFDHDQVEALNAYQLKAPMHPFTCPIRSRPGHRAHNGDGDRAVLVATNEGWYCRDCTYTQDWAWLWMSDPIWWQAWSS